MDTTSGANCECIPKVRRLILYSSSQHQLKPAANMPSPPDPSAGSTEHTHMTDASSAAAQAFRASPPPPKAYSFYNQQGLGPIGGS